MHWPYVRPGEPRFARDVLIMAALILPLVVGVAVLIWSIVHHQSIFWRIDRPLWRP